MEQKNWFNLTVSPALYCRYAYFDLEDHLADSLFERQHVSVKYEQEFSNPVNPYRLIVCKVLPWRRKGFLKALGQLPNKMNLLGFNDYQDFCRDYLDYSEKWMVEQENRRFHCKFGMTSFKLFISTCRSSFFTGRWYREV